MRLAMQLVSLSPANLAAQIATDGANKKGQPKLPLLHQDNA